MRLMARDFRWNKLSVAEDGAHLEKEDDKFVFKLPTFFIFAFTSKMRYNESSMGKSKERGFVYVI